MKKLNIFTATILAITLFTTSLVISYGTSDVFKNNHQITENRANKKVEKLMCLPKRSSDNSHNESSKNCGENSYYSKKEKHCECYQGYIREEKNGSCIRVKDYSKCGEKMYYSWIYDSCKCVRRKRFENYTKANKESECKSLSARTKYLLRQQVDIKIKEGERTPLHFLD
ncbi:MAG: hypothetical protein ABEJ24_03950 [Candidatus Magasanikbacteria bacterium]